MMDELDDKPVVKKMSYSHLAMAEMILANPGISQNKLAATFGYTPGWISQIVNSDGFQLVLSELRDKLVNPQLTLSIEERLRGIAAKSADVLQEKLAGAQVSEDLAVKALEISTRALGYGARQTGVQVNAQFVVALPPKAESSAAWADRQRALPAGPADVGGGPGAAKVSAVIDIP